MPIPSLHLHLQAASVLAHPLLQKLENSILLFLLLSLAAYSVPYVGRRPFVMSQKPTEPHQVFVLFKHVGGQFLVTSVLAESLKKKPHKIA